MENQFPAIFVHGLFGFGPGELGSLKYWGSALDVESPLPRFEASVGPISSAHDRACELAAQIKGTLVDYGEPHSLESGHERFGKDYSGRGFVPDWDETRPVHLVGHSHGGPTIRCLQHLLQQDYWGWGSNHRWVHSINSISGVLNGSTLVFLFGADKQTGLMHKLSLISPILPLIQIYTATTRGAVTIDSIYDFDVEQWGFCRKADESLTDYLKRMLDSRFLWEKDNAAWSLTLQGAYEDNASWETYRDTWYFSYITAQTWPDATGRHWPTLRMNPGMMATSTWIGHAEFEQPPIPIQDFNSSDWWENDGLVPTYSQKYPRTAGDHPSGAEIDAQTSIDELAAGHWHYQWQRDMDHLDICLSPEPLQIRRQQRFYRDLLQRLAWLPARVAST